VKVTTSPWSQLFGVPVAVLGPIFLLAMTLLCSPGAWRKRNLDSLRVAGATGGVGFALYLVWIELYRVDAICLWCTAVHLLVRLLLISILWTTSTLRAGKALRSADLSNFIGPHGVHGRSRSRSLRGDGRLSTRPLPDISAG
jgi:uncharacterized membrane protein